MEITFSWYSESILNSRIAKVGTKKKYRRFSFSLLFWLKPFLFYCWFVRQSLPLSGKRTTCNYIQRPRKTGYEVHFLLAIHPNHNLHHSLQVYVYSLWQLHKQKGESDWRVMFNVPLESLSLGWRPAVNGGLIEARERGLRAGRGLSFSYTCCDTRPPLPKHFVAFYKKQGYKGPFLTQHQTRVQGSSLHPRGNTSGLLHIPTK